MLFGTPESRAKERAARAWRVAKTAREAWQRFARWLRRNQHRDIDDGDAPHWQDPRKDFSGHELWTGAGAKRLLLFEKRSVMNKFNEASYRASPNKWTTATIAVPFAPFPFDIELISHHARRLGVPIGFVGDADPHGLHLFGALRSGKIDAPDPNGHRLEIEWLGIDDRWLRAARRTKRALIARTIQMKWVEREYWFVIKRFMPRVEDILGEAMMSLLDTGTKAEADAFLDVMPSLLISPRGARARYRESSRARGGRAGSGR